MFKIILSLLLSFTAFAQDTSAPVKESSSDLRSGLVVFSIEDTTKNEIYWLERTANLDFYLYYKNENKEKIQKIDSRDAKKMDQDFAARFIKCEYELPASQNECPVTLRLSMKGEKQVICAKDEEKTQEIIPFMKDLNKRF